MAKIVSTHPRSLVVTLKLLNNHFGMPNLIIVEHLPVLIHLGQSIHYNEQICSIDGVMILHKFLNKVTENARYCVK
jgi:hypothetical protein